MRHSIISLLVTSCVISGYTQASDHRKQAYQSTEIALIALNDRSEYYNYTLGLDGFASTEKAEKDGRNDVDLPQNVGVNQNSTESNEISNDFYTFVLNKSSSDAEENATANSKSIPEMASDFNSSFIENGTGNEIVNHPRGKPIKESFKIKRDRLEQLQVSRFDEKRGNGPTQLPEDNKTVLRPLDITSSESFRPLDEDRYRLTTAVMSTSEYENLSMRTPETTVVTNRHFSTSPSSRESSTLSLHVKNTEYEEITSHRTLETKFIIPSTSVEVDQETITVASTDPFVEMTESRGTIAKESLAAKNDTSDILFTTPSPFLPQNLHNLTSIFDNLYLTETTSQTVTNSVEFFQNPSTDASNETSPASNASQILLSVQEIPWPVKKEAVVEGDIILGGLMMVHEREDTITCGPVMPQGGIQALEAMLYTLDKLNESQMLPNITIGAHILDDCDKDTYGLEMAVDFIKEISTGSDIKLQCNLDVLVLSEVCDIDVLINSGMMLKFHISVLCAEACKVLSFTVTSVSRCLTFDHDIHVYTGIRKRKGESCLRSSTFVKEVYGSRKKFPKGCSIPKLPRRRVKRELEVAAPLSDENFENRGLPAFYVV
ncbi:GPRMGL5 [Trypoxylus dichotomus]